MKELTHKLSEFFSGEDFAEHGVDVRLEFAPSDLMKIMIITAKKGRLKTELKQFYQKGLDDAWECARKIERLDGISPNDLYEMFGTANHFEIFPCVSASEAIEKIKEYEKKKKTEDEIKVGDEVIYDGKSHRRFVVTQINLQGGETLICGIDAHGSQYCDKSISHWKRTGRHFDQIAEVLEQMKEE